MEIIRNKGSPEDKLRLFLVFYLSLDNDLPKEDMLEYETALRNAGCSTASIEYVKRYVRMVLDLLTW